MKMDFDETGFFDESGFDDLVFYLVRPLALLRRCLKPSQAFVTFWSGTGRVELTTKEVVGWWRVVSGPGSRLLGAHVFSRGSSVCLLSPCPSLRTSAALCFVFEVRWLRSESPS